MRRANTLLPFFLGGTVTIKDEFNKILEDLTAQFGFSQDKLHDTVVGLFVANPRTEVARIVCSEKEEKIGISFHINLYPTDTIQVYNAALALYPSLQLFNCYYQDAKGHTYTGLDAQIKMEQDRQHAYTRLAAKQEEAKKQEEFELRQLDKKGKITFH